MELRKSRSPVRGINLYFVAFVLVAGFADPVDGQGCFPNPCKNDGTCQQEEVSFSCRCTLEYDGPRCLNLSFEGSIGIAQILKDLPMIFFTPLDLTDYRAARPGGNIELSPEVDGSHPRSYQWKLNGTALDPAKDSRIFIGSEGTLSIENVSLADEGEYQLFVSNEYGTQLSRKISVKMAVTGTFLNVPLNLSVTENEPYLLPCPPRSYSYAVSYDWRSMALERTSLSMNQQFAPRILREPSGDLLFSYVTQSDFTSFIFIRGNFYPLECEMTGLYGDTQIGPPVYFHFGVGGASQAPAIAPKFYTRPKAEYNVASGEQFYLNCTAGGRPTPNILWYKNNVPVENFRDGFEYQVYNRTLRISSLDSTKHDGVYTCAAENNHSRVETIVRLNVLDEVSAIYSDPQNSEFDIIAGKHGGTVTLSCSTTGNPFKWVWFFNGVPVQDSPKLVDRWSVSFIGDLTLTNLKLDDFGFYQCIATNLVSEHDRRTLLVVTGAPLPPVNLSVSDCTNYSTTIMWEVRVSPDLQPPTGFILESASLPRSTEGPLPAYKKVADIQDGAARSFDVHNLTPYTQVYFRIRAKNAIGIGFPRIDTKGTCHTSQAAHTKFPSDLAAFPGSIDGVLNVQWNALDQLEWYGPNCIYRLFYRLSTQNATWSNETTDCSRRSHVIRNLILNTAYEITIRAENAAGKGPISPIIVSVSGQNSPVEPPNVVEVIDADSSSVVLEWQPIPISDPLRTVDGYWIFVWTGPVQLTIDEPPTAEFEQQPPPNFLIPDDAMRYQIVNSTRGRADGLSPWTRYALAVRGYNSGGMGPTSVPSVTVTLDSKDSYYILSFRITSLNYTDGFNFKTSTQFISLGKVLKEQLALIFRFWFKEAELLSTSPGSVIAEVQMRVASPNMSLLLEELKSRKNLGNITHDPNELSIISEADIESVSINTNNSIVNVSERIVLICTVIGGPDDMNITWFKENQVIGQSNRTKIETGNRYSKLTIRDVMPDDEAKYHCTASKGIQNATASVTVGVVPVLEIHPDAVTKLIGEQVTFNCKMISGERPGAALWLVEITNDNQIRHQGGNYTASSLQIPDNEETATRKFVCELTGNENELVATSKVAELTIARPATPKCQEERVSGVSWSVTARGSTDIQPCPGNAFGTASRICLETGEWGIASFIGCSSPLFSRLKNEAEEVTEGFQTTTSAEQVLSELVNATKPITNDTDRPLEIYGGDLFIAVDILQLFADYVTVEANALSTENDVQNFVEVTSNLLESNNVISWLGLEQEGKGRSQPLVKAVDDYGLAVAQTFIGRKNTTVSVQAKNLLMRIDLAVPNSSLRSQGLTVSYNRSSISLPYQVFGTSTRASNSTRVVTVVHLTLNDVLLLGTIVKDQHGNNMSTSANTTIVSSSVVPRPPDVLNEPVKIVLQNTRVNVSSGATPEASCVFWRPDEPAVWQTSGCRIVADESDAKMTTCECDHLTMFAAVMDPFDSSIAPADKKALDIISIVGCCISLLAVLVTMAVTLFFWKALKGPRSIVLLNLCAAIAVVCILVICERSARDNKTGCTIVAVLLHYFLLALFSWMLCEGALLYILLVKVFGGGAEHKVKYFYLFGWGFPLLIVTISLAATQAEGYGTSEVCWLDVDSGLIWAFIAPAIVIIVVNIIVFALVIRQMMGTRHVQNKSQVGKVKAGVKATAVILPLLGITWIFGLLAFNSSTVAFKYIFTIFNSLQGLMIFIFHCVLNKQVKDAIKRRRQKASSALSSNPNSKPSPNLKVKHFVGTKDEVVGKKKRSDRAQNNYEMVESVASNKDNTLPSHVSTLSNKAVTLEDPNVTTQPTSQWKLTPAAISDDHASLAPFENDRTPTLGDVIPHNPEYEVVPEVDDGSGRKVSTVLLLPRFTKEDNSPVSHPMLPDTITDEYQNSVDGIPNHLYEEMKNKYESPTSITGEESRRSRFESSSSSSSSSESDAGCEGISLEVNSDSPKKEISLVEDLPCQDAGASTIAEENKECYPDLFQKETSFVNALPDQGLGSSNMDKEYDEMPKKNDPQLPQGEVCFVDESSTGDLGGLPDNPEEPSPTSTSREVVHPKASDDGEDDTDFEEEMKRRRTKVDSVQLAAAGFNSSKLTRKMTPNQKVWQGVRQKLHSGGYKLNETGGTEDLEGHSGNQDNMDEIVFV